MKDLLNQSIAAAVAAGNAILKIYNDPQSDFSVEKKEDSSPLTIADRKSHETIISHLEKTEFPILSEEGRIIPYEERKQWSTLWIVDPLDGTKEFIKRNGEFTVNIALVEEGKPILGVIYVPVSKTLYFGSREAGAFRMQLTNSKWEDMEECIPLPLASPSESMIVVASRTHMSPATSQFIDALRKVHRNVVLKSSGSSLKICLVAEGSAHIYPRFAPTMEWDTAAGHAIALAAGKNIYSEDSNQPLTYNKEDLRNPWFIVK